MNELKLAEANYQLTQLSLTPTGSLKKIFLYLAEVVLLNFRCVTLLCFLFYVLPLENANIQVDNKGSNAKLYQLLADSSFNEITSAWGICMAGEPYAYKDGQLIPIERSGKGIIISRFQKPHLCILYSYDNAGNRIKQEYYCNKGSARIPNTSIVNTAKEITDSLETVYKHSFKPPL